MEAVPASLGMRGHNLRRHHGQHDTTGPGAAGSPSTAPADREMKHCPDSPRLARHTRKVNDGPNRMYGTDDPGRRKPKHPRHVTGDQLDMLWHRWRQLAGRR
jgi:hypothetical protein